MFKHIVVPLDGSTLAESALPAAACLADMLGAKVTLVHIIEEGAPASVHGELHLTETDQAETYLETVARRSFPEGAMVERHVHTTATRDVAESIVSHQGELLPDLIVMCTHGRHGLRRMIIGSIAEKVIASGRTPVLLIHPEPERNRRVFGCHTLLVPVDGDPVHEQGLDIAVGLAAATKAKLHLLSVVPTRGTLHGRHATTERFMPATTRAALDLAEENLRAYVQSQLVGIAARGVSASGDVRFGDTGDVIVDTAERVDASMIVIGTHGTRGTRAFWAHSVGAEVQAKTTRPLLLVPVRRDALRSG
jgi:nucleotide-binding universal stress UspA family protein